MSVAIAVPVHYSQTSLHLLLQMLAQEQSKQSCTLPSCKWIFGLSTCPFEDTAHSSSLGHYLNLQARHKRTQCFRYQIFVTAHTFSEKILKIRIVGLPSSIPLISMYQMRIPITVEKHVMGACKLEWWTRPSTRDCQTWRECRDLWSC